jgi:hypothetical protein
LGKHLRNPLSKYSVPHHFKKLLVSLSTNAATGAIRPVFVSLDIGVLCSSVVSQASSNFSPIGLTMEEILDIAMIAGANANVRHCN